MYVELDAVRAGTKGTSEGGKRILRCVTPASTVSDQTG
jgi:hypothetical protein